MSSYDPVDTCPYDPVHRIIRSKMQMHLTRCAKNFPNTNKKQCPFDARHIINPVEFSYHLDTCTARESVVHYKYQETQVSELPNIVPIDSEIKVPWEENWDDEHEVRSFNPHQNIKNLPVVRTLIGASKAKRREFRERERARVQEIDNQRESKRQTTAAAAAAAALQAAQNTAKDIAQEKPAENHIDEEYKPLRRPKKNPSLSNLNMSRTSMNDSINLNSEPSELNTSIQRDGQTDILTRSSTSERSDNKKENASNLNNDAVSKISKGLSDINIADREHERKKTTCVNSYIDAFKKSNPYINSNSQSLTKNDANFPALR